MKNAKSKTKVVIAALLSSFVLLPSSLRAQGALTPPDAPMPTMKSLDQVEPRTPVDATHTPGNATQLYVISQPGSYYLTGNIAVTANSAIAIAASGVTLDLNGFQISSTSSPAGGAGILLVAAADVTILNGRINGGVTYNGSAYTGPGFQYGIYYSVNTPANVRVSGLSVSGCSGYGIYLPGDFSSEVDHCTLRNIGNTGITAGAVNQCTVIESGGTGIFCETAASSYAVSTAFAYGIYAVSAQNCYASCTQYIGIQANTISNCRGDTVSGYGIYGDIATACYGRSKTLGGGGVGMSVTIANNCYGYSEGAGYGLGATIAVGSSGYSNSGTAQITTYHYDMPPSPQTP